MLPHRVLFDMVITSGSAETSAVSVALCASSRCTGGFFIPSEFTLLSESWKEVSASAEGSGVYLAWLRM